MSEVTSGPDAVSALEEDSLEYQSPAAVMSAASNFAQGPPTYPLKPDHSSTHTSNQMSLQELIEAELNSRLAPLQPDSLEGGLPDYHEHIRTTVINGDVTATCASLLDSLEASPFSLDSLVDVESGVDLTSPPNPALGGSPPSPYSPFIHNSSSNQINNINLNGQQNSNHTDISENQTAINSDTENDFVIFESLPSKEVNDLKTENLIENIMESNVTFDLNESANTEVKDIAESNNIILIDEDDNTEDVEHVVVENISFEINTTSETVLESHCLQSGITNGFEQKAEKSLIEHKTVEKQLYNVKEESLIEVSMTPEEKFKTCNGSDVDRQELKSKHIDDISETNFDGTNSLDKDITTPAYDLIVNDFHELEQPKKASSFDKFYQADSFDKFYQADSFSDFKISHFSKFESIDESTTVSQQNEVVSRKISNVDFLETVDPANDPNESNNFSQSEGIKLNNFSQSESLSMETSHKLIKNIVDVSNSYNIIDIINNKDVAVYNNSLLPADVHVANMDETELWPEEEEEEGENGKKEEMDEFQMMEREVEREMEEEQKKKKKSDTDKRGKKKKKRKGESEKENKEISPFLNNSFSSTDEADYDDDVTDDLIKDATRLNGLLSPFENGKQNCDQLTTVDDDDLANISVKQLTASYLSMAEQSPRKRSPSPNSTPIRPRTPISRLVGTYSSTHTPASTAHLPAAAIHASTPNGTTNHIYPSDFTPGITLKSLKSAYEASAQKRPSPCSSPVKEEVHVSFSQLREAYCNVVASQSPKEGNSPTPRSTTPLITPSTFRSMEPTQVSNDCRICGKLVFQMEKIVAEKASWHKNCFRCIECNKNLTLETYQSHEGSLYCKPHFKELFRPKAVVQDEAEERKDRPTEKPDYGLEELQTSLNVKERFAVFESYSKAADEPKLEPVSVRRSQSLMSKAARFSNGHQNGDLEGEEEEYESVEEMEDEVEEGEEGDPNYVKSRKKKERPMSFSGMGDLKAVWEQKQRREEMSQARKEDISKFRQMLCAGKNITLKEMFESGNFEGADDEDKRCREEIKIEDRRAAHNLKARFEKGQPFILEDEEGSEDGSRTITLVGEKLEVEEVFKDAQTAKRARNVFKQIDSKVIQEGSVMLRSPSFAAQNRDNRRSLDGLSHGSDDLEVLGRDPNLIKCTDNYQDEIDCRNTKNILQMFKKMEMGEEEEEEGPRPLKCFTPPPEDGDGDESEYSDEEYSDEGEDDETEEDDDGKPKFKDELLEMEACPQSARKAANLRAKFEKWEVEEQRKNDHNRDKDSELEEECRPSLDTTRNLKAMFEHKAIEVTKPVTSKPVAQKINRFVGVGEKCMACDKTVYAMERLEIHGKILHKNCFKCFKCKSRLSMGSFSFGGEHMFCTTHYKQLFTEKGSYDAFLSGKDKWTSKIEATNAEAIKSHD